MMTFDLAVSKMAERLKEADDMADKNPAGNTRIVGGQSNNSSEEDVYEVEKIVGMCKKDGKTVYRVRWEGYGPQWDTWEPYENLVSCKDMIEKFMKEQKRRKRKLNMEVFSPEESSDGDTEKRDSESDKSSRKKGTKGTYYYVNNSDDEADTLKDRFWRDLEQGKIDVFSDDLYSKVKSQGRASRPSSLTEKTKIVQAGTSEEPSKKRKKSKDRRGRKRVHVDGERKGKRCNSTSSTSSSVSGVQAGSAASVSSTGDAKAKVGHDAASSSSKKGKRKRGRKKKLVVEEGVEIQGESVISWTPPHDFLDSKQDSSQDTEEDIEHTKIESCPASPEVERIDCLSAPASPDEVNLTGREDHDIGSLVGKTETLADKTDTKIEPLSVKTEQADVSMEQGDPKLRSPCMVVVENLVHKARRPVHPTTPSTVNTSPLAAKSPLDISSPALPTTSVSESWRQSTTVSHQSPLTSQTAHGSESVSYQVTDYKAIFTKQENAQTRTDLEARGLNEPQSPSPRHSPSVVSVKTGSPRSASISPAMLSAFAAPVTSPHSSNVSVSSPSMLPPSTNSSPAMPGLPEPSPRRPSSEINQITPSPAMSEQDFLTPSPIGRWSDSSQLSPAIVNENDLLFDFDLPDLDIALLDLKQLDIEQGFGRMELSNVDLRQAVRQNDYERVRVTLKCQSNLDLEQPDNYYGMTLVMLASQFGFDDMLELLVLNGGLVNARQKNGATALMHACEQGHRCTVELLLALGAHVNIQQSNGETALMKAVRRGNKHIVQLLLEAGANFSAHSNVDNSAIKQAKQSNNTEILDLLNTHINRAMAEFNNQVNITLNNTAQIISSLFPLQCFALAESEKFTVSFNHELQQNRPGAGMLLFIAHARITATEAKCRFYGPCAVTSVLLNGVPLKSLTEEAYFVLSFTPVYQGRNTLDIITTKVPKTKAKLLVCAYKAQLIMPGE